jgi:hypothetical protein
MQNLAAQRCYNHAQREAAARCPGCGRCFCRECVTEHEDRLLCAECLKRSARLPLTQRRGFVGVLRVGECLVGVFTAWFFFYAIGDILVRTPSSFHEGTLGRVHWFDKE